MEFDPTKQYGNFIEIVPPGKNSVHPGGFAVMCGFPWDDDTVDFAEKSCFVDARQRIPREYLSQIKIIKKVPDDSGDPLTSVGIVGWKYKPLQKGSV